MLKTLIKKTLSYITHIRHINDINSYVDYRTVLERGVIIGSNVSMTIALKRIGRHTFIHDDVVIENTSTIGAFCSISRGVRLGLGSHPQNFFSTSPYFYSKNRKAVDQNYYSHIDVDGHCTVADDVLISANVCVLAGVNLSQGCIIGAGAVVTKDVPPYAIVAGVPARIIKYRFRQDVITQILSDKLYSKSDNELLNIKLLKYSDDE